MLMSIKQFTACLLLGVTIMQTGIATTEIKDPEVEDALWTIISENSPNDYVSSGILAFFWRESYYKSDAVAHWHRNKIATGVDPGESFTEELDKADRKEFISLVRSAGGYGLGQWYGKSHLESFYDFCKGYNTSFSDARMQCLFAIHGCTNNPDVWDTLENAKSAHEAGRIIASLYDGTTAGRDVIAEKAEQIYRDRVENKSEE